MFSDSKLFFSFVF